MRGVRASPAMDLAHRGEARHGPPRVGKALRPGPCQQEWPQVPAWRVGQWARRPRDRLGGERGLDAWRPRHSPRRHRTHRRLHPAPPRVSSGLGAEAPPRGGAVVRTWWVSQGGSCPIRYRCAMMYATLHKIGCRGIASGCTRGCTNVMCFDLDRRRAGSGLYAQRHW
jgi:hypothetical protein